MKPRATRGGARPGAGRKPGRPEPLERHTITLYQTDAEYLRTLDSNLSRAIRKLVETFGSDPDAGRPVKKTFIAELLRQEKDAQRAAGKRGKPWKQVKRELGLEGS
jgi:hypothetical protein